MKILHLLYESKGDYFGIGGVGTRAYEIYKYLKDRHDITFLCKKYPGARDKEIEGLRHIFVGTESRSLTKTLLTYAYKSGLFLKKYGKDYDVIIEEFSPAIPTFSHAFTKRPIILQVQGYTGRLYFKKYNFLYALVLYFMEYFRPRFYKNFIFISAETAKKLLSKIFPPSTSFPSAETLIKVIPNGISPELLNTSPEDGDYILYLGRIDIFSKGLDLLIRAYEEFYKSFPHIKMVIAGDGKDIKLFRGIISKLPQDTRKNIKLTGWISGDNKAEVIRNALFCVFPSRHEVQPISVLEAMAFEKAIIVSDIPEFSYIIENEAGLSFKSGDVASLSKSLKELMVSNKRHEIGTRGRNWVKEFTWERVARQYEDFLKSVFESS